MVVMAMVFMAMVFMAMKQAAEEAGDAAAMLVPVIVIVRMLRHGEPQAFSSQCW
jgi:hypothetical protein